MPASTPALTQPAAFIEPRSRPTPPGPSRRGPRFADALAGRSSHEARPASENQTPAREGADPAPADAQEPAADAQPAPDADPASPKKSPKKESTTKKKSDADASTADASPHKADQPGADAADAAHAADAAVATVVAPEKVVVPVVEPQAQREAPAQGGAPKPTQKDSALSAPSTSASQASAPADAPPAQRVGAADGPREGASNGVQIHTQAPAIAAAPADAPAVSPTDASTNAPADASTAAAAQSVPATQQATSDTKKNRIDPHIHAPQGAGVADAKGEPIAGRVVAVDSVLTTPHAGARPQGQHTLAQALARADAAGSAPIDAPGSATQTGAFRAQVSRGIEAALRHDGGSVTLRLKPDTLGALRIDLQIHQGEIAARFHASTREAHELLTSHLSSLRASLEAKGLGVRSVDVQTPTDARGGDTPRDSGQNNAGSHGFSPGAGGQTSSRREDPGANAYAPASIEPLAEAEPIDPVWRRVVAVGSLDAVA